MTAVLALAPEAAVLLGIALAVAVLATARWLSRSIDRATSLPDPRSTLAHQELPR